MRSAFVCSALLFFLLLGTLIGGTVLRAHGAHGVEAIFRIFEGGAIGAAVGVVGSLFVLGRAHLNQSKLKQLSIGFLVGSTVTVAVIVALDYLNRW